MLIYVKCVVHILWINLPCIFHQHQWTFGYCPPTTSSILAQQKRYWDRATTILNMEKKYTQRQLVQQNNIMQQHLCLTFFTIVIHWMYNGMKEKSVSLKLSHPFTAFNMDIYPKLISQRSTCLGQTPLWTLSGDITLKLTQIHQSCFTRAELFC